MLTKHLAAAAEMYAILHHDKNVSAIKELVKAEEHSHGWSYIAGSSGDKIAEAWVEFVKATGIKT